MKKLWEMQTFPVFMAVYVRRRGEVCRDRTGATEERKVCLLGTPKENKCLFLNSLKAPNLAPPCTYGC